MRKIELTEPNTRIWKRWRRDCEKATKDLLETVEAGQESAINERLYKRKSIKDSWFFAKDGPFHGKCAYCEAPIPDYQHGDVEHFRPKGGVTDAQGEPVEHPGYYWLAYDWRNLLPACIRCNQPGIAGSREIGKHTRFPVEGQHALTPEEVDEEKPLLVHPASGKAEDDPKLHLLIKTKTGRLGHLTKRGEACIEIFGLNLRDQLVTDRLRACREVRSLLISIATTPGGDPDATAELLEIKAGKRSFTMAQHAVLDEVTQNLQPLLDA